MVNTVKTALFAGFGLFMAGCYALAFWLSQPTSDPGFELVGKAFYDFDPANAGSLEVVALDSATGDLKRFKVENRDGLWVISSHFNYPAEAAKRLADTTSALMGLRRDALQGRLESEQGLYQVVDPLDEAASADEAGTRITVRDKQGEVLVDYIVGEQAPESDAVSLEASQDSSAQYFYVRRPDEQQTFKVKLDVDLSARFVDWIDPDVMGIDSDKISKVVVDNYSIEEINEGGRLRSRLVPADPLVFTKDGFAWSLEGLDENVEQLETAKIDELIRDIDEMQITAVRPKAALEGRAIPLLKGDLSLNLEGLGPVPESSRAQLLAGIQDNLRDQGFFFDPYAEDPDQRLFATRGKVQVGTQDALRYTVYFGDVVIGDDDAIELGLGELQDVSENSAQSAGDADSANGESPTTDPADNERKNRFVMVRVVVDEDLLGEPPVEPQQPQKPDEPEDYVPSVEYAAQFAGDGSEDAPPKPPEFDENLKRFQDFEAALATFATDSQNYATELAAYQAEIKERKQTLDDARDTVKELNFRFGPWYYLVQAGELESMRLSREAVVSAKEQPPNLEPELPGVPSIEFPQQPKDEVSEDEVREDEVREDEVREDEVREDEVSEESDDEDQ